MLSQPSFSSPLINEDLPEGPQLIVFTLNKPVFPPPSVLQSASSQARRTASWVYIKYKVVGQNLVDLVDP
jgi:hypothetical protein